MADLFELNDSVPESVLSELLRITFGFAPLAGKQSVYTMEYVVSKINFYFPQIIPVIESEMVTIAKDSSVASSFLFTSPYSLPATLTMNPEDSTLKQLSGEEWRKLFTQEFLSYLSEELKTSIPEEDFELGINTLLPTDFPSLPWVVHYTKFGKSEYLVRVEGKTESGVFQKWTGKVKPIWIRNLAVANRNINYHTTIDSESVQFQSFNYFDYREPAVQGLTFPKIAKSLIREGEVIEMSQIEDPPYVKAGQVIQAYVSIGGVEVRGSVQLLKDAQIGDIVQAKNVENNTLVTGTIEEGPLLRIF